MRSAPFVHWLKAAYGAFSGHYSDCRWQKAWLFASYAVDCFQ